MQYQFNLKKASRQCLRGTYYILCSSRRNQRGRENIQVETKQIHEYLRNYRPKLFNQTIYRMFICPEI